MKKSLVAAMFAVMMISLVGCGKASEPKTIETTEVVEESETEEATEVEAQNEVVDNDIDDDVAEKPVVDEEPVAEPYSYADVNQTMYAQSTVNVRSLPEQSGEKLGSLTTNQEVTVLGKCNETGWYKISYNGGEAFVSNSYLGSEKVASQSSKSGTGKTSSTASQSASNEAAAEAPAETTDDNPYAGMTVEEASDSISLDSNSYDCPYCGYTTTSYDEYKAHMDAEGLY